MGAALLGADALQASLQHAALELGDMRPAHLQVAQAITGSARSAAPRRTGRLAGSGRPDAQPARAIITFGGGAVPYAAVIHWGWPRRRIRANTWAVNTARRTEDAWMAIYEDATQAILDTVKGA